jgi:hypothetical protein
MAKNESENVKERKENLTNAASFSKIRRHVEFQDPALTGASVALTT